MVPQYTTSVLFFYGGVIMNEMGKIKDVLGNLKFISEMMRQCEDFLRTMDSCSDELLWKQAMMAEGVKSAHEILQVEGIDALTELIQEKEGAELTVPETV